MDDELCGATKSPNIDYFFMKELVGKIDQLNKHSAVEKAHDL